MSDGILGQEQIKQRGEWTLTMLKLYVRSIEFNADGTVTIKTPAWGAEPLAKAIAQYWHGATERRFVDAQEEAGNTELALADFEDHTAEELWKGAEEKEAEND